MNTDKYKYEIAAKDTVPGKLYVWVCSGPTIGKGTRITVMRLREEYKFVCGNEHWDALWHGAIESVTDRTTFFTDIAPEPVKRCRTCAKRQWSEEECELEKCWEGGRKFHESLPRKPRPGPKPEPAMPQVRRVCATCAKSDWSGEQCDAERCAGACRYDLELPWEYKCWESGPLRPRPKVRAT